jgi:hypothetical protein
LFEISRVDGHFEPPTHRASQGDQLWRKVVELSEDVPSIDAEIKREIQPDVLDFRNGSQFGDRPLMFLKKGDRIDYLTGEIVPIAPAHVDLES